MKNNYYYLSKRYQLCALHFLSNPKLNEDENRDIFGNCYRLHGHNYFITIKIKAKLSTENSNLREKVDLLYYHQIYKKYANKNLNDYFEFTSGESLVQEFSQILISSFDPSDNQEASKISANLVQVTLEETPKNTFIYKNPIF